MISAWWTSRSTSRRPRRRHRRSPSTPRSVCSTDVPCALARLFFTAATTGGRASRHPRLADSAPDRRRAGRTTRRLPTAHTAYEDDATALVSAIGPRHRRDARLRGHPRNRRARRSRSPAPQLGLPYQWAGDGTRPRKLRVRLLRPGPRRLRRRRNHHRSDRADPARRRTPRPCRDTAASRRPALSALPTTSTTSGSTSAALR
jgi:hypothetical protein